MKWRARKHGLVMDRIGTSYARHSWIPRFPGQQPRRQVKQLELLEYGKGGRISITSPSILDKLNTPKPEQQADVDLDMLDEQDWRMEIARRLQDGDIDELEYDEMVQEYAEIKAAREEDRQDLAAVQQFENESGLTPDDIKSIGEFIEQDQLDGSIPMKWDNDLECYVPVDYEDVNPATKSKSNNNGNPY